MRLKNLQNFRLEIIKKVKNWRTWFPHIDKVVHFIAGFIISLLITLMVGIPVYGFAAAFIVGLIKERYDHEVYGAGGSESWLDWFATIAGGALLWIIW